MTHKPNCAANLKCLVYHGDAPCPGYRECVCGATTNTLQLNIQTTHPHTCNPDTAFVRVVEYSELTKENYRKWESIQKICPDCGKIISEVEVKNK